MFANFFFVGLLVFTLYFRNELKDSKGQICTNNVIPQYSYINFDQQSHNFPNEPFFMFNSVKNAGFLRWRAITSASMSNE